MYWDAACVLPLDPQKRTGDYAQPSLVIEGQGECSGATVRVVSEYGKCRTKHTI
jgi:hypothetical protein